MLGIWLSKRFILTDWFFSITPFHDYERLREIVDHAVKDTVEVEVHPEIREETEFLLGCQFLNLINSTHCGGFLQLPVK